MKKLTVAIHLYSLPGVDVGGTQYATSMFAKWLANQGHSVYILTQAEPGFPEKESRDGYTILRISRGSIPFISTIFYFLRAVKIVRNVKADIFHEQGICGASFFVKLFSKAKCIIYGRGGDVYGSKSIYLPLWLSLTFTDTAIALTNNMKERFQRVKNRPVLVVSNANFNIPQNPKSYPRKWKFVSIGRLHPDKGHGVVLHALNILRNRGWDVTYTCIGGGSELPRLQLLANELGIAKYVEFLGHVQHDKLAQILKESSLFVFPTNYPEGFPNVFLDAFAAGLPAVTSTVSGNAEIVRDGELGFCVPPKDPQAVADACERIMKDKVLYEKMSRNCIAELKRYDPEKVYGAIVQAYSSLL